ncbi:MAG TPA: hypothetical protein ENN84_10940 [Candidatus Marinimicrobia bacterium]|nr:hypothetical protein [Candidatus Neomarinimicrobiota bacterium]
MEPIQKEIIRMAENTLSNLDRAAIIFKVFGNSLAVSLFRSLTPAEMNRIRKHADTLSHVPFKVKKKVLEEYYFQLMSEKFKAPKDETEKFLFDYMFQFSNEQIVFLLAPESALVKALAISQLPIEQQAAIIKEFDSDEQADILMNMSEVADIPYEGVVSIEADLKEKSKHIPRKARFNRSGSKQIAELLTRLDPDFERQFVSQIQNEDPDLAKELAKFHLSFEDFSKLPIDVVRDAVKSVDLADLAMAMKGMDAEFVEFMNSNIPQKAQIMLEDELRDLEGPQPRRKVETARRKLVDAVMKMAAEGRFSLEDFVDDDMIE